MAGVEDVDLLIDDHPLLTEVGRIANLWAFLEGFIDMTIDQLVGANSRMTVCLTAQFIGPAPRMNALLALVREKNGSRELIAELDSLAGRIQGIGTERNRAVHDPLFLNEKTGEILVARTSAKRTLEFTFDPVDREWMKNLAKQIDKAATEFIAIHARILQETKSPMSPTLPHSGASA